MFVKYRVWCRALQDAKRIFSVSLPTALKLRYCSSTFLNKPHLKQVPIEKNLSGYLYRMLFILVKKNLGLKRQRASDLKSFIGNVWESKLPWKLKWYCYIAG